MDIRLPLALAADHGGYELKNHIRAYLEQQGIPYRDFGVNTPDSVDYPDVMRPAMEAVLTGECALGLLFCGTGVGISIAANKLRGVRACCCSDTYSAEMSRRHNNANALCMGGRVVGGGLGVKMVEAFLAADFEGGHHLGRVEKLKALDDAYHAADKD